MNRFLKTTILSAALAATTLTALVPADARDRWRHHHDRPDGDLLAAGMLGLAVGAIAVGALSDPVPYRPSMTSRSIRAIRRRARGRTGPTMPSRASSYYQDQAARWSRGARNGTAIAATATAASTPTPAPSSAMTARNISASAN